VIGLGTWRQRHRVKDFVAVYRDRPGVVIELDRSVAPFRRLVLSLDSAAELQRQLGAGRGGGPTDVVG
jgi:hypothetical protein